MRVYVFVCVCVCCVCDEVCVRACVSACLCVCACVLTCESVLNVNVKARSKVSGQLPIPGTRCRSISETSDSRHTTFS